MNTRFSIADAAVGLLASAVLLLTLISGAVSRFLPDLELGGYLVVWLPLLGAVLYASFIRGSRSLARDFGIRFHWLDLLWGLAIGLLARVCATIVELVVYGRSGSAMPYFDDRWWIFFVLIAPLLVSPIIEELFFRGLLLRSLLVTLNPATAIGISSMLFALLHVLVATTPAQALVTGLSTLILGIALATLTVLTRRAGGAIVAHVAFNALVVIPGLVG